MSSRYQVRYTFQGTTRCGIVSSQKSNKPGYVVVEDAVMPFSSEQLDSSLVDIPMSLDLPTLDKDGFIVKGGSEYELFIDSFFRMATAIHKAAGPGVKKGKLFYVGVADGSVCYVITDVKKTTVKIEWRGFGNGDRYMDARFGWGTTVAKRSIEGLIVPGEKIEAFFEQQKNEDQMFLAGLSVGSVVHSGNGWGDFTRWEVIAHEGGKAYKAIGLVGEHKHNLPSRSCLGVINYPYAAQQVIKGEIAKSLQVTCLWEGKMSHDKPGKNNGPCPDPTKQPVINLTLPELTVSERETVRLWETVNKIRKLGEHSPNRKGSQKHPAYPQGILADMYKVLREELAKWTVDDMSNNGLKDELLVTDQ